MRLRNIPRAKSVLLDSPFVIQNLSSCRGAWASDIFQNNHPLHIEIGMGKGKFLLTLARQNPDVNYIGIERYDSVLLRAVEKLEEAANVRPTFPDGLNGHAPTDDLRCHVPADDPNRHISPPAYRNLRLLCLDAARLSEAFAPGEVSRIYLNFSDPWPKARHAKRRLTSKEYFARYDSILASDGQIEFKTDNLGLFRFSVWQLKHSDIWEIAACTYDLHHDAQMSFGNVLTEYEEKFSSLGNPICKLIARRKAERCL